MKFLRIHYRTFPWRLFSSILASHMAVMVILFFLALEASKTSRVFSAVLFLCGLGLLTASVFKNQKLLAPMGRLIDKIRESLPSAESTSEIKNEPDEWGDLESGLDRLLSDLRGKTEDLASEREELSLLMSSISEAILAIDLEGEPLFYNTRFALLFTDKKINSESSRLAQFFRAPEVLEAFQAALDTAQSGSVELLLPIRQDPELRHFLISISPLKHPNRGVYGAVGIFHDVTELKRAEKIRIDFVANVSHELRTPLTSIKGYSDTLKQDLAQNRIDGMDRFVDAISRNVDRLMSLINDLLDLSALESDPSRLLREPIEIQPFTERVIAQFESRRAAKSHQIETVFETDHVDAEPRRLEQVLTNLLENAIKYVPSQGQIRVVWQSKGKTVMLRVSDNGPGIAAEHLARLFERFYRVDRARSRDMGGTGLGLAIVKHIMQRHGGSVSVTSEMGKGTEFTCVFPQA